MENLVILVVLGSIGLFLFVVIAARRQSGASSTDATPAVPRSAAAIKAEFEASLEDLAPVFGDQLRRGLEDVRRRETILKEVGAYQAAAISAQEAERQRYYREFLAEQEAQASGKTAPAA
jgi:hypothetical protein